MARLDGLANRMVPLLMCGPKAEDITVLGQGSDALCNCKEWERRAQQVSGTPVTQGRSGEACSLPSLSSRAVSGITL